MVVAWDVWARTYRWPSLIEDRRVLQWDFRRLVADVGSSFARQRLVLVAN